MPELQKELRTTRARPAEDRSSTIEYRAGVVDCGACSEESAIIDPKSVASDDWTASNRTFLVMLFHNLVMFPP
jgi:hypothetical protein